MNFQSSFFEAYSRDMSGRPKVLGGRVHPKVVKVGLINKVKLGVSTYKKFAIDHKMSINTLKKYGKNINKGRPIEMSAGRPPVLDEVSLRSIVHKVQHLNGWDKDDLHTWIRFEYPLTQYRRWNNSNPPSHVREKIPKSSVRRYARNILGGNYDYLRD